MFMLSPMRDQGAISRQRYRISGIWIPNINIRRSDDRLIFIIKIHVPGNTVYIETGHFFHLKYGSAATDVIVIVYALSCYIDSL